jgi:hypothetical protein
MSCTSKSPKAVAAEGLAVGAKALRPYSHRNSPKVYTQPQLFACLVLKKFFKTDYRGVVAILVDCSDLVRVLGLKAVPHPTTLQKASRRLLAKAPANRLLDATVRRFMGRRRRVRRAGLDSSGFDCGHASRYYVRRKAKAAKAAKDAAKGGQDGQGEPGRRVQRTTYKRFGKLELAVDCATHLILAAIAGRGPRPDTDRFVPLLDAALGRADIDTALADAGFDSEPNHEHARQRRGVRSVIPAEIGRPAKDPDQPPAGKWRRLMRRVLTDWLGKFYCDYGQRWQAETVFSMIKRRLGEAIPGRSYWSQCRELMLNALTHNVLILAAGPL